MVPGSHFSDCVKLETENGIDAYQTMMDGVADIPLGSDGLITLPYFAGERTPINDPLAKGILFGLSLSHTRQHMYRSALESVAYSVNQQLNIMLSHDVPIDQIFAVGGGVKMSFGCRSLQMSQEKRSAHQKSLSVQALAMH